MRKQKIVIIGAGGLGRIVYDTIVTINEIQPTYDMLGFIVDAKYGKPGTLVNDKPILGGFDWLSKNKSEVKAICAIGEPQHRFRLVKQMQDIDVSFCSIVHPSAILSHWMTIGIGTMIMPGSILCNQARIGNHVLINGDSTIGEDDVIEDFASVMPGVHVAANVTLKEGSYIGTGANIIEKVNIGAWSIIGAGSTIIIDVPNNTTMVGVPGKVIKTRPDGWHRK